MIAGLARRTRFIVCRPPRPPVEWTPPDPTDATGHDVAYFGRVLEAAAAALGHPPLTFILTWDLDELPELGRHVVAIVQGDEDGQIPRWASDVLVTFKCYGSRPPWVLSWRRPNLTDALEIVHLARRVAVWLPGVASLAGRALRSGRRPEILPVPLGYYNQEARPMLAPSDRRWLVSFAGSGIRSGDARGLRGIIGSPKSRSRAEMAKALDGLKSLLPPDTVATVVQSDFPSLLPGEDRDARELSASYSELLAQSSLCLVPRGNSPETFRFFEALRAGCVVVCESLPRHWFYRDAPVIRVRHWAELPKIVLPLVSDREQLEALHRASVEWWETRCSEAAVARYMVEHIRAVWNAPG